MRAAPSPEKKKIDPAPLLRYLISRGVLSADGKGTSFYEPGSIDGWRCMQEVNAKVTFKMPASSSPTTSHVECRVLDLETCAIERLHYPKSDKVLVTVDPNVAYVFNFANLSFKNKSTKTVGLLVSCFNAHVNEMIRLDEYDHAFENTGQLTANTVLLPETEGDLISMPMPELRFSFMNRDFIRTMALITSDNLWNGIVCIPPEVCVQAGLQIRSPGDQWEPTVSEDELMTMLKRLDISDDTPDAESVKKQLLERERGRVVREGGPPLTPVQCYYAVPPDHVITWPYRGASHKSLKKLELRLNTIGLVCYVLDDVNLQQAIQHVTKSWIRKTDPRPLRDVGIDVTPPVKRGELEVKSQIKYLVGPSPQIASTLKIAPTLSPDLVSFNAQLGQ